MPIAFAARDLEIAERESAVAEVKVAARAIHPHSAKTRRAERERAVAVPGGGSAARPAQAHAKSWASVAIPIRWRKAAASGGASEAERARSESALEVEPEIVRRIEEIGVELAAAMAQAQVAQHGARAVPGEVGGETIEIDVFVGEMIERELADDFEVACAERRAWRSRRLRSAEASVQAKSPSIAASPKLPNNGWRSTVERAWKVARPSARLQVAVAAKRPAASLHSSCGMVRVCSFHSAVRLKLARFVGGAHDLAGTEGGLDARVLELGKVAGEFYLQLRRRARITEALQKGDEPLQQSQPALPSLPPNFSATAEHFPLDQLAGGGNANAAEEAFRLADFDPFRRKINVGAKSLELGVRHLALRPAGAGW